MDSKTRHDNDDDHQQANTPLQRSSSSSSPNHEFSFTICLHDKSRASSAPHHSSSIALDLSPADDIFFHGHLLPLHLISHLPRPSTDNNSSLPVHVHPHTESRRPTKPFSLFGLAKWRKGFEDRSKPEAKRKSKKLSHLIKRYARMVRPLAFFKRSNNNKENVMPPFSFSGDLAGFSDSDVVGKQEMMIGKGEVYTSAPASMRTSPTNSGPLVGLPNCSKTTDSTMEELQAAIQAAIAHCKNSIATEDKRKCRRRCLHSGKGAPATVLNYLGCSLLWEGFHRRLEGDEVGFTPNEIRS